jgi:Neurotransmitter-gated ion-channel ligand binding domain
MRHSILILFTLLVALFAPLGAEAQSTPAIQELQGGLASGELDVYRLTGMKQGQSLTAFMENTSGNLDPAVFILSADTDLRAWMESYQGAVADLLATSPQPLLDLPALRDKYALAWDDDSGPGYSAALQFTFPADGDYFLIASSSLSAAGRQTAGGYRLLVGLDAPQVLSGTAAPTGAVIAVEDQTVLKSPLIQEYSGSLGQDRPSLSLRLNPLKTGDMLYVHLQAVSGDLKPVLLLRDYGHKPVQAANVNGQSRTASFQHPFPQGGEGYLLDILASGLNGQLSSGDFKLLVGVNAPEVLQGQGQPNTENILKLAIPVKVGFKLQQIVNIDQPNEIMNDVGTIHLEWTDPALAFDPGKCDCYSRLYTDNDFNKFLSDVQGRWPAFTFFNQQGNRWTQNRLIQVDSNGHVVYLERFSTNFQLDFDWTAYPFDQQDFYISVDMLYPEEDYVFVPMEGYNEIDPNNGEDEFILTNFDTKITSETSSRLVPTSRFTFHFTAPRHLEYYIFRIFVPILLIISVSYITFFLKDYTRRIEIATGNLLLFIAFSFSLGDNYPRMGYLTFLDAVMAITFIINTIVVMLNVYYKWLETNGQREKADRLEAPMNYIYPLAYLVAFGAAALIFLR